MEGCPQQEIDDFISLLGSLVDEDIGIAEGEVNHFYWMENGDFAVKVGTRFSSTVALSEAMYLRLLEVYIDPSRTVAPTLSTCVHENLPLLKF